MTKKETLTLHIQEEVRELVRLTKYNELQKPEDRADHTVSVVARDDLAVIISGSAHKLEDLFVDLLNARPEMRQVLDNAVYRYGQRNQWKL